MCNIAYVEEAKSCGEDDDHIPKQILLGELLDTMLCDLRRLHRFHCKYVVVQCRIMYNGKMLTKQLSLECS